jgi:hypothetical protein
MRDELTALMFDEALLRFGLHVENKLEERDEQREPVHTLEALLSDAPGEEATDFSAFEGIPGAIRVRGPRQPIPQEAGQEGGIQVE